MEGAGFKVDAIHLWYLVKALPDFLNRKKRDSIPGTRITWEKTFFVHNYLLVTFSSVLEIEHFSGNVSPQLQR